MDELIQPLRVAMETPRAADSIVLTVPENVEQQAGEVSAVPSEPQSVADVSQNSAADPNALPAEEPVTEPAPEITQSDLTPAVDPQPDPAPTPSLKSRR